MVIPGVQFVYPIRGEPWRIAPVLQVESAPDAPGLRSFVVALKLARIPARLATASTRTPFSNAMLRFQSTWMSEVSAPFAVAIRVR